MTAPIKTLQFAWGQKKPVRGPGAPELLLGVLLAAMTGQPLSEEMEGTWAVLLAASPGPSAVLSVGGDPSLSSGFSASEQPAVNTASM